MIKKKCPVIMLIFLVDFQTLPNVMILKITISFIIIIIDTDDKFFRLERKPLAIATFLPYCTLGVWRCYGSIGARGS